MATRPDFTPYYAALEQTSDIAPGAVLPGERPIEPNTAPA